MKGQKNTNAVRHGIFAEILLKGNAFGEEADYYCKLVLALRRARKPADELEEMLIEKLAVLVLRLSRFYKWDAKVAPRLFARVAQNLLPGNSGAEVKLFSPKDQIMISGGPTIDNVARYESSLERHFAKTLGALESLRQMRERNSQPALPLAREETPDEKE